LQLSGFVKVVNQGRIGFIEKALECKAKKDLGAVDRDHLGNTKTG
jgi:hypothetical protein